MADSARRGRLVKEDNTVINEADHLARVFEGSVTTLAAGEATTVDARGMSRLTVIAGTNATVTVSRVDSATASSHTTGPQNSYSVSPDSRSVLDVDWPFYRVSTASGPCRVALV